MLSKGLYPNRWTLLWVLLVSSCRSSDQPKAASSITEVVEPQATAAGLMEDTPQPKWLDLNIPQLHDLLVKGELKVEELTQFYLGRIERLNRKGPALHAVISINPRALAKARELDKIPANERLNADLLWGIPILVADTIETEDPLPTTFGSTAMKRYAPRRDADAVANLRKSGAIILGKTNVGEWGGLRGAPGWSAIGGQTINPHYKEAMVPGSSAGAAVAVASGMAVASIGTGTLRSILQASSAAGVIGIKSPKNLVSRTGTLPISAALDSIGAIARHTTDVLIVLGRMLDSQLNRPSFLSDEIETDIKNTRVGYVVSGKKKIPESQKKLWENALKTLSNAGAQLVPLSDTQTVHIDCEPEMVVTAGIRLTLEPFLKELPKDFPVHSLEELNEYNTVTAKEMLTSFAPDYLREAEDIESPKLVMERKLEKCQKVAANWHNIASMRNVDVILDLIPSQSEVWSNFQGEAGLSMPIGFDEHGAPTGLGVFALREKELSLIAVAHAFEATTKKQHLSFPTSGMPE